MADAEGVARARGVTEYANKKNGATQPGYKGGSPYANDGRGNSTILPRQTQSGTSIKYYEYDIFPYQKGVNRGGFRVVIGDNGSAYYTNNHYKSFVQIK